MSFILLNNVLAQIAESNDYDGGGEHDDLTTTTRVLMLMVMKMTIKQNHDFLSNDNIVWSNWSII